VRPTGWWNGHHRAEGPLLTRGKHLISRWIKNSASVNSKSRIMWNVSSGINLPMLRRNVTLPPSVSKVNHASNQQEVGSIQRELRPWRWRQHVYTKRRWIIALHVVTSKNIVCGLLSSLRRTEVWDTETVGTDCCGIWRRQTPELIQPKRGARLIKSALSESLYQPCSSYH
jgi:hypothetical protein